jgi:hypothetical protein
MEIIKGYKIRNKETGEFSKGGASSWNVWTKGGKTWTNIGHVKNHLNAFLNPDGSFRRDYPYLNAEIIEVEIKYEDCLTYDVNILVGEMALKKEEKSIKDQERYDRWIREKELKKLAELKSKYPEQF